MAESTRQQAVRLLDLFETLWRAKYGKKYKGNRHADQWGFRDIIDDLGYNEAKQVIEYYFHLAHPDHSRQWLIYNYDDVAQTRRTVEEDKERRKLIMQRTKESLGE